MTNYHPDFFAIPLQLLYATDITTVISEFLLKIPYFVFGLTDLYNTSIWIIFFDLFLTLYAFSENRSQIKFVVIFIVKWNTGRKPSRTIVYLIKWISINECIYNHRPDQEIDLCQKPLLCFFTVHSPVFQHFLSNHFLALLGLSPKCLSQLL